MGFADFIKPTKRKVILFILLFIISQFLILPVIYNSFAMCKMMVCPGPSYHPIYKPCSICGEPTLSFYLWTGITYIFHPLTSVISALNLDSFVSLLLIQEIIGAIWLYFISCLISTLFFRKK